MPAEEHSAHSSQEVERGQFETMAKMDKGSGGNREDQPVPGPSKAPARQGFCSCCQVVYSSVEQHILSPRHREVVSSARTQVPSGSLMERFLQDVIQHHPHRYNDTRPTHADLPSLRSPLVPREALSDLCSAQEDDMDTLGTREEIFSSDDDSCHLIYVEEAGPSQGKSRQDRNTAVAEMDYVALMTSSSSDSDRGRVHRDPIPLKRDTSPTKGFFHRTGGEPESMPQSPQTCGSRVQIHRKAHRKTNRRRNKSDSSSSHHPHPKHTTSRKDAQKRAAKNPTMGPSVQKIGVDHDVSSDHCDTIENVIEEVIGKYCYGISCKKPEDDEESIHLAFGSMANTYFWDSGTSMEWDVSVQENSQTVNAEKKNLSCLMEVCMNVEDQKYTTQLESALNLVSTRKETSCTGEREHTSEEVLPDLPHIPKSFVGKTWSQIMYEDDMKVDAIVREFREGCFRCYFESESLAKYGRRTKKSKKKLSTVEPSDWECGNVLPLKDHVEEDQPECSRLLQKRPGRRKWRLASRCQVVKVSHSTQTTQLSSPVVKSRGLEKSSTSQVACELQQDLSGERTPNMKTRMCALKLPESYKKIMSPLQAKTLVYILSSPDSGQGSMKPLSIRKNGRKRKSSESDVMFKYKYKKTPLKYYDPLTNRILKSPPKGASVCKPKRFAHVRQLFRSLSPDINKEKQEQKDTRSSTKGRGNGSMTELCASTSGSILGSVGVSELGSTISSRRALFTHSSLSSSSHFLPRPLTPATSHTGSTIKNSSETIQTRRRKRQGQKPAVECLQKDLAPAKQSSPPYKSRKLPSRLVNRSGRNRPEIPKPDTPQVYMTKSKKRSTTSGKELLPRGTSKKPLKSRDSVRMSPRSDLQRRTRSSARHHSKRMRR